MTPIVLRSYDRWLRRGFDYANSLLYGVPECALRNRVRRQSGFPTFISCQHQDANVLPKRRQSHQGDNLCDVSTVPLVARWPVFLARGSDADGEPHLQVLRSDAARVLSMMSRRDHIILVQHQLHWLWLGRESPTKCCPWFTWYIMPI